MSPLNFAPSASTPKGGAAAPTMPVRNNGVSCSAVSALYRFFNHQNVCCTSNSSLQPQHCCLNAESPATRDQQQQQRAARLHVYVVCLLYGLVGTLPRAFQSTVDSYPSSIHKRLPPKTKGRTRTSFIVVICRQGSAACVWVDVFIRVHRLSAPPEGSDKMGRARGTMVVADSRCFFYFS